MRILALALLLSASSAQALTLDEAHRLALPQADRAEFRFAEDSWVLTDDKAAHFGLGFTICTITAWAWDVESEPQQWGNLFWNAAFWTAWEIKDGLLPWERYGAIGGDGPSYKDWAYSMAGAALAMLIW